MVELEKPLQFYRIDPLTLEGTAPEDELSNLSLVDPKLETDETQLSFELERPSPRLRVVRRHPSI